MESAPPADSTAPVDVSTLLARLLDDADAAGPFTASSGSASAVLPAGRIRGQGKVSLYSPLYGRDLDLDTSTGVRVTLEIPIPGRPLLSPRVVLHLPTPPEPALRSSDTIAFSGEPIGFKPFARTLLLGNGRIEPTS